MRKPGRRDLLLSLSGHGPLAVALVPVAFGALVVGLLVDRLPRITGEEGAARGYAAWGTASTIGMLLGSGLGGVLIIKAGPTWRCSSCVPSAIPA